MNQWLEDVDYTCFNVLKLKENKIKGYLTDVLSHEPMLDDELLRGVDNIIITPHVGSRTYESVQRQGSMAVNNLLNLIKSES